MPFADQLISDRTATTLTEAVAAAAPGAALHALPAAVGRLGDLSLRERADLLRDALLADLPGRVRGPRPGGPGRARRRDAGFTGWLIWPVTSAVAARAVEEGTDAAFDDAMALLAELTGRLTAEFAIRTLLRHDLDRALGHRRGLDRLGRRRRAPARLRGHPPVPAVVGARAGADRAQPGRPCRSSTPCTGTTSDYVRRSVANHLNDLSRDHPELVVATAGRWLAEPVANTPGLVRHALRTLIKQRRPGRPRAARVRRRAALEIDGPVLDGDRVPFGGTLRFSATVRNIGAEAARLAIDYVVHHQKANGSPDRQDLQADHPRPSQPGEQVRAHAVSTRSGRSPPAATTPGPHAVALQVNGVATDQPSFELDQPAGV